MKQKGPKESSPEKYRSLVEETSDWVWEVDAAGTYTYSSPKVRDILGYPPGEVVGKKPFDFMDPEEAKRIYLKFKKFCDLGAPFSGLENTCRHRAGYEVFLETSAVPLFDSRGRLTGYRGIDRDIGKRRAARQALEQAREALEDAVRKRTAQLVKINKRLTAEAKRRKLAVDKLRESEGRYRLLVETMNEGLGIQNKKGNVVYVNPKMLEILGYSAKEVLGRAVTDFMDPGGRAIYRRKMRDRRGGHTRPYEISWRDRWGNRVETILSPNVFYDHKGRFKGFFAIITDVRKLKAAERKLQKSERELRNKARSLEEVNAALKVLLKQCKKDETDVQERITANLKLLVWPDLEKIREKTRNPEIHACLDAVEANIDSIISSFIQKLISRHFNLTPTELQVADLIRLGRCTKEIALHMGLSCRTVETHRLHIRKKLGITGKKSNLRAFLLSLS